MAIFRYIEGWYNPHLRHSALGYESPLSYERGKKEGRERSCTLTTFTELFAEATSEEKKDLLALHINQIIWTPQEIRLALFESPTEQLLTTSGNVQSVSLSNSGGRTRTCGPVVNSHLLCQLSYAGMSKELRLKKYKIG